MRWWKRRDRATWSETTKWVSTMPWGVPGTRPCDVSFSVLLVRDRVTYIPDLAGLGSGEASEQALGGGLGADQGARAEHAGEDVVEGGAYLLAWLGADVG